MRGLTKILLPVAIVLAVSCLAFTYFKSTGSTADQTADDGCKAAFENVGWVRYPKLLNAFNVSGCSATMMPDDPPDTVISYYVSKAESWQFDPGGVVCAVRCADHKFKVLVPLKRGPATVSVGWPAKPYEHVGASEWPLRAWTNPNPGKVPIGFDLGKAAYPGARQEQGGDTIRFLTKDNVETVRKYYEGIGATSKSGDDRLSLFIGRRICEVSIKQGQLTIIEVRTQ